MARRINQDRCIRCGACMPECPNGGITETDGQYRINSGSCTECFGFNEQSSCLEVCPVEAIEEVPGSPDDLDELATIAADLRPDYFPRD